MIPGLKRCCCSVGRSAERGALCARRAFTHRRSARVATFQQRQSQRSSPDWRYFWWNLSLFGPVLHRKEESFRLRTISWLCVCRPPGCICGEQAGVCKGLSFFDGRDRFSGEVRVAQRARLLCFRGNAGVVWQILQWGACILKPTASRPSKSGLWFRPVSVFKKVSSSLFLPSWCCFVAFWNVCRH